MQYKFGAANRVQYLYSQSLYVEVCAAVDKGDRPKISNNIFQKKVLKINFTCYIYVVFVLQYSTVVQYRTVRFIQYTMKTVCCTIHRLANMQYKCGSDQYGAVQYNTVCIIQFTM